MVWFRTLIFILNFSILRFIYPRHRKSFFLILSVIFWVNSTYNNFLELSFYFLFCFELDFLWNYLVQFYFFLRKRVIHWTMLVILGVVVMVMMIVRCDQDDALEKQMMILYLLINNNSGMFKYPFKLTFLNFITIATKITSTRMLENQSSLMFSNVNQWLKIYFAREINFLS